MPRLLEVIAVRSNLFDHLVQRGEVAVVQEQKKKKQFLLDPALHIPIYLKDTLSSPLPSAFCLLSLDS
jgi:hypothetical protein